MKKMLVVYYSWSNGNTKRIAEQLTNGTGADIARIETAEPYSGSHEDVVEQGKREVEAGFMPQINPMQWLLLCITPARETICPAKNMVQQDLKIRSRSIRYWRIKMRISTGYSVRM